MTLTTSAAGKLTLGNFFDATGVDSSQVLLLRHTYTADGLTGPSDLTPEKIHEYVRLQGIDNKIGRTPPFIWMNFIAAGGRRSRFLGAYENHGEIVHERTPTLRCFDLRPTQFLASFQGRLVIEWSKDAVNWAKSAKNTMSFPIMEISDPRPEPFPGFDQLLLTFNELQSVVEDSRYDHWRQALGSVQGIYLIADTKTGRLYVGKADGAERILGRWSNYAKTGHGGNVALRELSELDLTHREHFQFSILRVFGPGASTMEIDASENHYKRALLTRKFGLNRN
ncbi:GIY-YIG nuclease family protein [Paeniglutamicibacter cryotolerans]|uniref:GIY-YIG domain-containing protein n=1 Tax=Paeniglutamicibacter cryotolerans TaxID=670079 RepID=A0A839QKU2_9MICC|nr:GIY-YIG nuclease family protein [Paeniglutamicibacter cryotolerans]MBB2996477.1 hypothetical protein [Paeniglutamicibacter cryotolerans]